MKKYQVVMFIEHVERYRVDAESEEEAVNAVLGGEYEPYDSDYMNSEITSVEEV